MMDDTDGRYTGQGVLVEECIRAKVITDIDAFNEAVKKSDEEFKREYDKETEIFEAQWSEQWELIREEKIAEWLTENDRGGLDDEFIETLAEIRAKWMARLDWRLDE